MPKACAGGHATDIGLHRNAPPFTIISKAASCRRFSFYRRHAMSHVMNTYARQPVAFVRGQGVWLYDAAGKQYLDALAGIAVNTLGHNHPRLVRALSEQIARIIHTSNLFENPLQEQAADRIRSEERRVGKECRCRWS